MSPANSKKPSISSAYLGLRRSGTWGNVPVVPSDLTLIANAFVKDRPQKNRGVNIDVFVSREKAFHDLADSGKLLSANTRFWITETKVSLDADSEQRDFAMHILHWSQDFLVGYKQSEAFILELGPKGFCLVTTFRRPHHDKMSRNLLMGLYPGITRAFLTSSEIFEIISSANKRRKHDLRVRANFVQESGKDAETAIEYHGRQTEKLPTVDEIFRAKKNIRKNLTMYKLISARFERPFEVTFSGEGHVGLYQGDFQEVIEDYVVPTLNRSYERVHRFFGRSMSETVDRKSRPIEIDFESEQFTTIEDMKLVISHIQKYPHCNYCIVHAGNPHLFMYIMDSREHSTFSLRTLGPDRIVISPQIKTSPESLVRFTDHLLSLPKLSDGEIKQEA